MNGGDEKYNEKEMGKHDEKSDEEKSWEEKWRRDPLGTFIWALIFIWAGVVLLLDNMGLMANWIERAGTGGLTFLEGFEAWSFILLGAGVLFLMEVLIRVLIPAYRRPIIGTLIFGVILVGVGLGDLFSWNLVWPLVLIVLGGSILFRGLFRKSE
jgi:hypothetical protein